LAHRQSIKNYLDDVLKRLNSTALFVVQSAMDGFVEMGRQQDRGPGLRTLSSQWPWQ
jgi:hypothetical protein